MKNKKKIPFIISGVVLAIILIAVLIIVFGSASKKATPADVYESGYANAIHDYHEAFKKLKAESIINMTIPPNIQEEYFRAIFDMTVDEAIADKLTNFNDFWADIDRDSYDWEIIQAEPIDALDALEEDMNNYYMIHSLTSLKEQLKIAYADYGMNVDDVTEAHFAEIKESYKYLDTEQTETKFVIVYKYDGNWYFY